MKESRFIELLNLYVDHQLTPEEASELEREIQRNPQHRHTYQQYCRMQKACTQLFEKERVGAPASSRLAKAMADADRKVVGAPEPDRSFWFRGVMGTGLAAAAAFAVVLVVKTNPGSPGNAISPASTVVASQDIPAANKATIPTVVAVTAKQSPERAALPALLPMHKQSSEHVAQALRLQSPAEFQVPEWWQSVELRPIRPIGNEQFAFEPRTQPAGSRPLQTSPAYVVPAQPDDAIIGWQLRR